MVAGRVDHLTLTPGVKLYTQGRTARIDLVDQQGGTVELTSSAPFNVSTYMVSQAGGTLNVVWDTPSTTPLMQAEYTDIKSPVSVTLTELDGSIKIGDKVVLIESKRSKLTQFIQGKQTFAAAFDLTNSTDETTKANRLTLTLTGKGLKATFPTQKLRLHTNCLARMKQQGHCVRLCWIQQPLKKPCMI